MIFTFSNIFLLDHHFNKLLDLSVDWKFYWNKLYIAPYASRDNLVQLSTTRINFILTNSRTKRLMHYERLCHFYHACLSPSGNGKHSNELTPLSKVTDRKQVLRFGRECHYSVSMMSCLGMNITDDNAPISVVIGFMVSSRGNWFMMLLLK